MAIQFVVIICQLRLAQANVWNGRKKLLGLREGAARQGAKLGRRRGAPQPCPPGAAPGGCGRSRVRSHRSRGAVWGRCRQPRPTGIAAVGAVTGRRGGGRASSR